MDISRESLSVGIFTGCYNISQKKLSPKIGGRKKMAKSGYFMTKKVPITIEARGKGVRP